MRTTATMLIFSLGTGLLQGQTWTLIASDPAGDAPGGLDATALHYWYEQATDGIVFRITCTNLASYSTGPAADFSFGLPNGMDGGFPAGAHWTTPGTPVHKIASVYCDPGAFELFLQRLRQRHRGRQHRIAALPEQLLHHRGGRSEQRHLLLLRTCEHHLRHRDRWQQRNDRRGRERGA